MKLINKLNIFVDKYYKQISGAAFIAFGLIIVLYYILCCSKTELHADCFDTIMWANASLTSGRLFNKDFGYACLLPFGGQLLMLPFMLIFGLSYKAHLIGMVIFVFLFTASLVFMLRGMRLSLFKTGSITLAVLMTSCISEKLREIFWGHIIYYSLGLMFLFVGLGIALRIVKGNSKKLLLPILAVWTVFCATDGIQALTIYILPIMAAFVGYAVLDFDNNLFCRRNYLILKIVFAVAIGTVIGKLLMVFLAGDIKQGYADAYSMFDKSNNWFNNLSNVFRCHYTLMGVDINSKMPIMSFAGVLNIFKIIFATIVAIAPFFGLVWYNKLSENTKLFTIIYFVIYFLVMLGWVFGKISSANWRLTPIEISGTILTILLVFELCANKRLMRLGFTMLLPIIIYCLIAVFSVFTISLNYKSENELFAKMQFLEENNCTYGYATFWNANPITVLSDNKIKVRGVEIKDSEIKFRSYQTDKAWYDGKTDSGETYFILLDKNEFDDVDINKYPIKEIKVKNNIVLLILDENISIE